MRFLSRFFSIFRAFSRKTTDEVVPQRRSEPPNSQLARFVLSDGRVSHGRANHRAFMPPPDLELSMFNIDDLDTSGVWAIGNEIRLEQQKSTLYGRADLVTRMATASGVQAIRDDQPLRHVVLVGWPANKADQKAIAQKLAASSTWVPFE